MESTTDITCNICQNTFPDKKKFTVHQRIHSEDKFHPCKFCGIVLTTKDDLYEHNCADLTIERPFSCDICQLRFKRLSNLETHKRIHTGEKPYSCEICKKSFNQNSSFIRHKRIHTGEKPYSCKICKKSYNDNSSLKQHKRTHTGEKRYSCDICKKAFTQSSDLTKHKRIHSGEKPYSCEVCQKSFADVWALKRHNKSGPHLRIKQNSLNTNQNNYVDCGEAIKVEDIKEELNGVESVKDPLSLQLDNQTNHKEEPPSDFDYDKIEFTDIKIICQGKIFNCHRSLLSAKSPYFAAMFSKAFNEGNSTEIFMDSIHPDILEEMLSFIYCGKTKNLKDTAKELVKAADHCQLDNLKEVCGYYLSEELDENNCLDYLVLADKYNVKFLNKSVLDFVVKKVSSMRKTEKWKDMKKDHPDLMFQVVEEVMDKNNI